MLLPHHLLGPDFPLSKRKLQKLPCEGQACVHSCVLQLGEHKEEELRAKVVRNLLETSAYGRDFKGNTFHIMFQEKPLISEPGMAENCFIAGGSVLVFLK